MRRKEKIKGVSERLQRNINLYHKAGQTFRQVLVHPKDTMKPIEQCGITVVYETVKFVRKDTLG